MHNRPSMRSNQLIQPIAWRSKKGLTEGDFFSAQDSRLLAVAGVGEVGQVRHDALQDRGCFALPRLNFQPGLLQIIGGYAVMKANQSIGVPAASMALKWPNDVILHDGIERWKSGRRFSRGTKQRNHCQNRDRHWC